MTSRISKILIFLVFTGINLPAHAVELIVGEIGYHFPNLHENLEANIETFFSPNVNSGRIIKVNTEETVLELKSGEEVTVMTDNVFLKQDCLNNHCRGEDLKFLNHPSHLDPRAYKKVDVESFYSNSKNNYVKFKNKPHMSRVTDKAIAQSIDTHDEFHIGGVVLIDGKYGIIKDILDVGVIVVKTIGNSVETVSLFEDVKPVDSLPERNSKNKCLVYLDVVGQMNAFDDEIIEEVESTIENNHSRSNYTLTNNALESDYILNVKSRCFKYDNQGFPGKCETTATLLVDLDKDPGKAREIKTIQTSNTFFPFNIASEKKSVRKTVLAIPTCSQVKQISRRGKLKKYPLKKHNLEMGQSL